MFRQLLVAVLFCVACSSRIFAEEKVGCHPHLVVGNGLDTRHLEALHGMAFTAPPEWSAVAPFLVSATVQGRPRSAWRRRRAMIYGMPKLARSLRNVLVRAGRNINKRYSLNNERSHEKK